MSSFAMVLRMRARMAPNWRQMYGEVLSVVSASQQLEVRVHSITPFVEVLVDDRDAPISDARIEAFHRLLATTLQMTSLSVHRLSDEPVWRRDASWSRAWAPSLPPMNGKEGA